MTENHPRVGVGIIVFRTIDGVPHILMHQRKGTLATNYWGTGGGHVKNGESLEAAVLRELREEAGRDLKIKNLQFLCVTNITQFKPKHYIDISFRADWDSGEPMNTEPHKATPWGWYPVDRLPQPLLPPVADCINAIRSGQVFFDATF